MRLVTTDVVCTRTNQRHCDAFAHLSGPDDQDAAPGEGTESLGGHLDRRMADRGGVLADGRLGAGSLACLDGMAEEEVEGRLGATLGLGGLPGGADLAEDLALTEHSGVEPGSDLEQVAHRSFVVLTV